MDYFFIVGMFVFEKDDYISVDYKILFSDVVEWNFVIKCVQLKYSGIYECQISVINVFIYYVYFYVFGNYFGLILFILYF